MSRSKRSENKPGAAPRKRASAAGPKAEQKRAAEERERAGRQHTSHETSRYLRGDRIDPKRIDGTFLAYNAARLREASQLLTTKMLEPDVTVGLTLTGALTPAGLGMAALIPLIEAGVGGWVISNGAEFFHHN